MTREPRLAWGPPNGHEPTEGLFPLQETLRELADRPRGLTRGPTRAKSILPGLVPGLYFGRWLALDANRARKRLELLVLASFFQRGAAGAEPCKGKRNEPRKHCRICRLRVSFGIRERRRNAENPGSHDFPKEDRGRVDR